MALRFKNSLTQALDEFTPITPGKVRIYSCGPTVYNFAHIGNLRAFMFSDLLRRYLKYKGYEVEHVMNITDVDDKIIKRVHVEKRTLKDLTNEYTEAFFDDLATLGMERVEKNPRATDHINEMVAIIQKLVEKGLAYEHQGNYYYRIANFKDYGKLAHLDMEGLKAGARVASDEYHKDAVSDFALWKAWDEADGEIFWETAIGKGRPGWHIECSAMSMRYLGDTFDIHTGGVDLMFPHHENEIAQSEGSTGKKFVNYWLHNDHLIVEGKKMSKSLGNFFTLRDLLDKGYSGLAIRYLLLSTHYRQQLNFTFDGLTAASNALERYNDFLSNLKDHPGDKEGGEAAKYIQQAVAGFEAALDDDLNISGALGSVFDFIRDINRLKAEGTLTAAERDDVLKVMARFNTVLNFEFAHEAIDSDIEALILERTAAKKARDFATADKIRDQLADMGIILEDTPQGVKWKRKV